MKYAETGYNGKLVSLAGVEGWIGKGRTTESAAYSTSGGSPIIVLQANPKRIAAILHNSDDTAHPGSQVYLYLGSGAGLPTLAILNALGSLQIDINFPWTGEVWALAVANNPVLTVTEVAIL